jgi:serine/threonine protein kinase
MITRNTSYGASSVLANFLIFARKIVSRVAVLGQESKERESKNEVRVVEKLQATGGHNNIISVWGHGELDLHNYFFDMELCIMNLDHFICGDIKSILGWDRFLDPALLNSDLASLNLWVITKQITSGLDFLHSHRELHRDLKPKNGKLQFETLLFSELTLRSVTLFEVRLLENNGF